MKRLLILIFVFGLFTFACKKENSKPSNDGAKLFTFNQLKADEDSLKQGDVTSIRAKIAGEGSFAWSCTSGDIFGTGNTVLFGAGSCCAGNHEIICTVKDKNNNSEAKSIFIYVY